MPDGSFLVPMNSQTKNDLPPAVHIVFPAQECAVRRALQSVCAILKSLALNTGTLASAEIVLAEVTNNIVEHAYEEFSSGTISLTCCKSDNYLWFEIVDQGKMLPGGELPPKREHDLSAPVNDLPEGGFGWGLIRDLTNNLSYKRCDSQNILRFTLACV